MSRSAATAGPACTDPFGGYWDGGTPHFGSVGQARAELAGWRWDEAAGTALCRGCAAAADCARDGHQWGERLGCNCGGRVPGHSPGGCPPVPALRPVRRR